MPAQDGMLFKEFAQGEFMDKRRREYPKSTWASDDQRLKDYLVPTLGHLPLNKISSAQVRALLSNLVSKEGLSPKTRDRVRALISSIFNEALNRDDGPLVTNNPTFGLSFKTGKRMGVKKPSFMHTNQEGVKYFVEAAKLSSTHLVIGALGLNGGLRKQEMIALRWRNVDFDGQSLEISEKYIQASGEIVKGTKGGEHSIRYVPMSDQLIEILLNHLGRTKFSNPDDFVLTKPDGSHLGPRDVYNLHIETCAKAEVKVTVHGLRHTFGREFNEKSGGNVGALKDILGHSNLLVTQQYSTLGKERLKGFREVVSFDVTKGQKQTNEDNQ